MVLIHSDLVVLIVIRLEVLKFGGVSFKPLNYFIILHVILKKLIPLKASNPVRIS